MASPGQGLPPYKLNDLIGRKAGRALQRGDFLFESDLKDGVSIERSYRFPVKWGVQSATTISSNITSGSGLTCSNSTCPIAT